MKTEWADWQLIIKKHPDDSGVFVAHNSFPRFVMRIHLEGFTDEMDVSWRVNWRDARPQGMDWQFEALRFYNDAIRQYQPV